MLSTQDRLLLALYRLYRQEDCYVWTHHSIIVEAGEPVLTRNSTRKGLKALRQAGYAHHSIAFSLDEPEVRGSGHYITHEGITYLQEKGLI